MDSSPAPSASTEGSNNPASEAGTVAAGPAFPALFWTGKAVIANLAGQMIPGRELTPEEVAYWFRSMKAVNLALKHGYYATSPPATDPPTADPPATGQLTENASDEEDHDNA